MRPMVGHRAFVRACTGGAAGALLLTASSAAAWTPPEHTLITKAALTRLLEDAGTKVPLERAWWHVVSGAPRPIAWPCEKVDDDVSPACVSFADLPSLAADHSCAPSDLLAILQRDTWVYDVLARSRATGAKLAKPDTPASERLNLRKMMHRDLQIDDPQYLTRAESVPAHFQAAREQLRWGDRVPTLESYLRQVLENGQITNATGLYVNFHAAAISLAAHARHVCQAGESAECSSYATSMLMAEAFALHFLEDSFAAGHFVGQWGESRALRMGTHDYYSDHWLEARTWKNETYVAHGDAFFGDADLGHAAPAVTASLRQVILAFDGRSPLPFDAVASDDEWGQLQRAPSLSDFDTCKETTSPMGLASLATSRTLAEVLEQEPMPTPRNPEIPRFRAELGPFLGFSGALDGDFGTDSGGLRGRIGMRGGYGLTHISARGMDTHLTAEIGAAALSRVNDSYSQTGFAARAHIPFGFLPGDGIFVLPLAAGISQNTVLMRWALIAAGGSIYGSYGRVLSIDDRWSLQVAALRDVSFFWFPNQWDLLFPGVKLRHALPFSGAIANDVEIELGGIMSRFDRNDTRSWSGGAVLSVTASTRIFLQ